MFQLAFIYSECGSLTFEVLHIIKHYIVFINCVDCNVSRLTYCVAFVGIFVNVLSTTVCMAAYQCLIVLGVIQSKSNRLVTI